MELNKTNLSTINSDIVEALQSVANKHGVQISRGNCSFTANNANLKIVITAIGENGEVETKEASDFKLYAFHHKIPVKYLNKEVTIQGRQIKILGYKPRSSKYPVLIFDIALGKRFKYQESVFSQLVD